MSTINSEELLAVEDNKLTPETLPPRHTKHGKRRAVHEQIGDEEEHSLDKSKNKRKGFYYIQIILYTFLALIVAIIIYYYANQENQETITDDPVVDPMEVFLGKQEQNEGSIAELSKETVDSKEESTAELEDNQLQELDKPEQIPEMVREEQKKEYADGNYTGVNREEERVEEPPQNNTAKPEIMAVHTVQAGETLYSITMRYYQSRNYLEYLADFNGIKDPTTDVRTDMKLQIPAPAN